MTLGPLCGPCPLKAAGATGYAVSRGTLKHGVLVVAEALGKEEAQEGLPLVGPTGRLTNRMINRTPDPATGKLLRDQDFMFTNIIRCRPPDNELRGKPWEHGAIETCSPYLDAFIKEHKPRAILALGDSPLGWFTGQHGITTLRGYAFQTQWGAVVPTYHPAYLMRGKTSLADIWIMDLLKALFIARNGGVIPKMEGRYLSHPSVQQGLAYVETFEREATPSTTLVFDLETPMSDTKDEEVEADDITLEDDPSYTILMCSFSWREREAITFPWMEPFISMAKRMFKVNCVKAGWNIKGFDLPRLAASGVQVNGPILDGMSAWHFLFPAFPMGLKYVAPIYRPDLNAWKLEAKKDMAFYCAIDSDAALCAINGIVKTLKEQGRWEVYLRDFVRLGTVLNKVSKRGIPVDVERRKEGLKKFDGMYAEEMRLLQTLVPDDLKPIEKVYKKSGEEGEKWLKKTGKWVEGRMVKITRLEPEPKPRKSKAPRGDLSIDEGSTPKTSSPRRSGARGGRRKKGDLSIASAVPQQISSSPPSPSN